jgi:hypothetical protein
VNDAEQEAEFIFFSFGSLALARTVYSPGDKLVVSSVADVPCPVTAPLVLLQAYARV